MPALSILILSDGRPGHYHLSEGVAAAIGRRRSVEVRRLSIARRRQMPGRILAGLVRMGWPKRALAMGYGLAADALVGADLVISAGGDTIAANAAVARLLGSPNILCGTLRHLQPEDFNLVISSYASHAGLPRHLVALKPSGFDPDVLGGRADIPELVAGMAPEVAGLLVGGESGLFHYEEREWQILLAFLIASRARHGTRWVVSTSRRTPDAVADQLMRLAGEGQGPIQRLIDFRHAGPGTLPELFRSVQAILCTEDSSTMLSEAVCARLPVVGVAPRRHAFKSDERSYRTFMAEQGWCRFVPIADLSPDRMVSELAQVRPLSENHLDRLADALRARLPALFV